MKLYRTTKGILLEKNTGNFLLQEDWNTVINQENLFKYLTGLGTVEGVSATQAEELVQTHILAPIETQEVWAAGVTYLKSRDARMDESKDSGGADCYQKVYDAERPEIFFKSLAHRVAGPGGQVYIRKDSVWNVPEPELTLYINSAGSIQAYTVGNDMSSRSIEGENPLYLPQAKTYERSAALGPCLWVPENPINPDTVIRMVIYRNGGQMYFGEAPISRMKRSLPELVGYLYRGLNFADGCFLMTGTCLVPPNSFTLAEGDTIEISIDGIGTLKNTVGVK